MDRNHHVIDEPKFTLFVLQNPKFAWFWLIVRVYVGWQWLIAGLSKFDSPAWTGADSGIAISNFVHGALAKMGGAHPDVQSWYGWFLSHVILPYPEFWSHFIAYGEMVIGVALILGLFTGFAAFFGFFLNLNFLLAGTVSTNPVLMLLAIAIILAWRVAGFFGLDYWVLPAIGTPWRPRIITTEK
ncbi:MAG: DoxX family membrane protein [Candidatus Pacebacteria bacterium]|nr:DoxX family membrane protein [Candidatus Paceibacterota bacterium]